jgi:hypothetical protein
VRISAFEARMEPEQGGTVWVFLDGQHGFDGGVALSLVALAACLLWGSAATYCFFEAWMAFLGIAACLIGWVRRKRKPVALAKIFYERFLFLMIFGLALVLQFTVFWTRMGLGRTPAETLAFLLTATATMFYVGPRIRSRIDGLWRDTNGE